MSGLQSAYYDKDRHRAEISPRLVWHYTPRQYQPPKLILIKNSARSPAEQRATRSRQSSADRRNEYERRKKAIEEILDRAECGGPLLKVNQLIAAIGRVAFVKKHRAR
jgi:hypothetical protein